MVVERTFKRKDRKQEQKPKIKYEAMTRLSSEKALIAHKAAMDRGANCTQCPLFGLKCGPVMGEIKLDAAITVIGEAPGENELREGKPFVGKSGGVLDRALLEGGVAREDCTITNATLCRPPEDFKAFEYRIKLQHQLALDKWEKAVAAAELSGDPIPDPPKMPLLPHEACFPRLKRDIEESHAKVVLAVGGAALRGVADYWDVPMGGSKKVAPGQVRINNLKKQLGSPITMADGTIVVATYHPAFAMRPGSKHYMHLVKRWIARAAEISRRGHIDWEEPPYILNPDVETIEKVLRSMRGKKKTIDIETDKGTRTDGSFDPFTCRIRCIGFGAKIDGKEVIIVVPIRHRDGSEWWPLQEKKRVIQAVVDALNDDAVDPETGDHAFLIGHNLAFDTSVLLRYKLLLRRDDLWGDTMIMHHDTIDNDAPHDLGFVAASYFEVPSWKGVADDKFYDQDKVTDDDLHLYNARDVLTTMRLYEALIEQVYRCGTLDQYQLDQKIAPIARDMGELGLFIDERRRGALSVKMNAEAHSRILQLQALVKDPKFNPNSTKHIQRYLFGAKQLVPVINTKGKDWEEGEDPSTNTNSLLGLIAKRVCDDDTKKFINLLLEYRAYQKLRSTYIDKIKVSYPDWKKLGVPESFVPMLPPVHAQVWHPYNKKERAKLLDFAVVAEIFKTPRKERTKALNAAIEKTPEGEWRKEEVIPARPAISRLNTTYKIHIIPSGRMSTTPAIQNIPERGKANIRDMFCAPPGHVLVGADFDQIELRLYAVIANDKLLIQAFKEGLDAHAWNAATLFKKKFSEELGRKLTHREVYNIIDALPSKEKKKLRNIAKVFVYLVCYGGEADKLFVYMSMARDKASGALMFPNLKEADVNEWYAEWHRDHPETRQWQAICERVAQQEGFTAPPIGTFRKRFFPGGSNKPGATYNHVIQACAAEVANASLVKIAEQIPYQYWSPFTGLCLQVHDYCGVFVPIKYAKKAKQILQDAMNTVVFGLTISSKPKVSKRWSKQ